MGNNAAGFRHELKFHVNHLDAVSLSLKLKHVLSLDKNAGEDGKYTVSSLYFDDFNSSAIRDKIEGFDRRYKFRIRAYNRSPQVIKLEKKTKQGQFISKTSVRLSANEFDNAIYEGGFEFGSVANDSPLWNEFLIKKKLLLLKPKLTVEYEREAFVDHSSNQLRITFDSNLRVSTNDYNFFSADCSTLPATPPYRVIMEVKYNNYLPSHILSILNMGAHPKSAISKYVLCSHQLKTNY